MNRRTLEFLAGAVGALLSAFTMTQLPLGQRAAPALVCLAFMLFVLHRFWVDVVEK